MIIELARLPNTTEGVSGPARNRVPSRALFLAPDAAKAFLALERESGGLVYVDMFQHADGVLAAKDVGRGTKEPGYSPHGFGIAFDLDVDASLRKTDWGYERMIDFLEAHGFYTLRRDRKRGPGEWSFTFLGRSAPRILGMVAPDNPNTWPRMSEHAIMEKYSSCFRLNPKEQQEALARIGLFHGEVDGVWGSLSKQARLLFERAFLLNGTDPTFQRVLAWAAAERRVAA